MRLPTCCSRHLPLGPSVLRVCPWQHRSCEALLAVQSSHTPPHPLTSAHLRRYYCPEGSDRPDWVPCGNVSVYCPPGSGAPSLVPPGFFSVGPTEQTRNDTRACTRYDIVAARPPPTPPRCVLSCPVSEAVVLVHICTRSPRRPFPRTVATTALTANPASAQRDPLDVRTSCRTPCVMGYVYPLHCAHTLGWRGGHGPAVVES
jgi:hypothetical protein